MRRRAAHATDDGELGDGSEVRLRTLDERDSEGEEHLLALQHADAVALQQEPQQREHAAVVARAGPLRGREVAVALRLLEGREQRAVREVREQHVVENLDAVVLLRCGL
jgi:hypothetical protein